MTCAVEWRSTSRPSGVSGVTMLNVPLCSMGRSRSSQSPAPSSLFPSVRRAAIAAFARRGPIEAATSAAVTPFRYSRDEPSGSVIVISSAIVRPTLPARPVASGVVMDRDAVIVEVGLNEAVTRAQHAAVPYSPGECADDARRCADAGAAVIHWHAREPVTGAPRFGDAALYGEALDLMRTSRTDVLAYPTYPIDGPPGGRLAHCWQLARDHGLKIAPIDVGSVSVVLWDDQGHDFVGVDAAPRARRGRQPAAVRARCRRAGKRARNAREPRLFRRRLHASRRAARRVRPPARAPVREVLPVGSVDGRPGALRGRDRRPSRPAPRGARRRVGGRALHAARSGPRRAHRAPRAGPWRRCPRRDRRQPGGVPRRDQRAAGRARGGMGGRRRPSPRQPRPTSGNGSD